MRQIWLFGERGEWLRVFYLFLRLQFTLFVQYNPTPGSILIALHD